MGASAGASSHAPMRARGAARAAAGYVDRSEPLVNVFDDLSDIEDSSDDEEFVGYGITNGYWIGSTRYVFKDRCHALLYLYIYAERY